jgi:hypothetical protein
MLARKDTIYSTNSWNMHARTHTHVHTHTHTHTQSGHTPLQYTPSRPRAPFLTQQCYSRMKQRPMRWSTIGLEQVWWFAISLPNCSRVQ